MTVYQARRVIVLREQGGAPPRSSLQNITEPVGANSFAKAMVETMKIARYPSNEGRSAFRPPRVILILGAPLNHAGRSPILIRRANRQGCRFSRTGPGMALCGGPPNQCRIAGMPSLGEGPSGGARAFCLLLTGPAFRLLKSEAL